MNEEFETLNQNLAAIVQRFDQLFAAQDATLKALLRLNSIHTAIAESLREIAAAAKRPR